jgi:hypothetical protein
MARFTVRLLPVSLVLTLTSAACTPTAPDQSAQWGSDEASLTIAEDKATVQIVTSTGCYGAYGNIDQTIGSGSFSLSGTYTQLTGVAPGSVRYAAQYFGTVAGDQMTLSISVPALQLTLGPFSLTSGAAKTWPACQYP